MQLTGRGAYAAYGPIISKYSGVNIDLVANPDMMLQIGVSSLTACAFFTTKRDNRGLTAMDWADKGDLEYVSAVTHIVNGGENGMPNRQAYFIKAKRLLG